MTYEGSSERRRRKKEKDRVFSSVGDTDVGDNAELKNLKELAICAAGLGARQATFQDANTHSLVLAGSLVSDVKKLLDLGVPLHASFLANVQLAAAAVYGEAAAIATAISQLKQLATQRCTGCGQRLRAAFPRPRAPPHTASPARVRVTAGCTSAGKPGDQREASGL